MQKRYHIVIVYDEPEVVRSEIVEDYCSQDSIRTKEEVEEALKKKGYNILAYPIKSLKPEENAELLKLKPQVVFNLSDSPLGSTTNEALVPLMLEQLGLKFTGADYSAIKRTQHKAGMKRILEENRLPTPKWREFFSIDGIDRWMDFPAIVKPVQEEASIGLDAGALVYDPESLKKRVEFVLDTFHQPALVERYIEGREINVALLGNKNPKVLPISEIDFSAFPPDFPRFCTYNAKWVEDSIEFKNSPGICPARLGAELQNKIEQIALKAFKLAGRMGYGRVDMRISKDNQPFILEVNANPSISLRGGFARSAKAAGLNYPDLLQIIVEIALED